MLAHSPKIITDGLVLCLDAGNPKSYPGSGTTWSDLSGQGNNGTLVNGPTYSSSNGGYLSFDSTNNYAYSYLQGTQSYDNNYTFEIWAYFPTGGVWHNGIGSGNELLGIGSNAGQAFSSSDGAIALTLNNNGSDTVAVFNFTNGFTCNYVIQRDTWYHLVATHTPGTNGTKLYVNGSLYASANMTATGNLTYNGVSIGGGYFGYSDKSISISRIYNRALSASEIQQNFNATKSRFQ